MKFNLLLFFCYICIYNILLNKCQAQSEDCNIISKFIYDYDGDNSCCGILNHGISCELTNGRITSLDIYNTNIQEEIEKLTQLEELYINDLQDSKNFEYIYKLPNLKNLELIGVSINVDSNLKNLEKLEQLYIDQSLINGNIDDLFPIIYNLSNLKSLILVDIDITLIPPGISKLKNLEELSIEYSKIVSVPDDIYKLSNLKKFEIVTYNWSANISFFKFYKFGNGYTIENCAFTDSDILCYQPDACKYMMNEPFNAYMESNGIPKCNDIPNQNSNLNNTDNK
eukprot:jgi/Orpsp1_1/1186015/evm.model.c7180000096450.1